MSPTTFSRQMLGMALLLGMAVPTAARACTDETLQAVLHAAYPHASVERSSRRLVLADEFTIHVSQVQCTKWPTVPGWLLVAVPLIGPEGNYGVRAGDLELLVAVADTANVQARYRDRGRLDSDAIQFDGLSLDTAHYQLTKTLRAFGVRVDFRTLSRPNPFSEQSLDLYVLRGNVLEPVVRKLVVRSRWSEWDMNCEGMHTKSRRTVAVAPVRGSTWTDLVVRSQDRSWRTKMDGSDDCVEFEVELSRTADRIRFDGERYPLPGHLEGL